jgi:hypothetical protein
LKLLRHLRLAVVKAAHQYPANLRYQQNGTSVEHFG